MATAYRFLERFPGKTVTVLEKEAAVARHQTGRNSGVLHSGIYYRPGSLRAPIAAGKQAMEEFCQREGMPFDLCGKVIVAIEEHELPQVDKIIANGTANGVRASGSVPSGFAKSSPTRPASRRFTCPRRASSITPRSPAGLPRLSHRRAAASLRARKLRPFAAIPIERSSNRRPVNLRPASCQLRWSLQRSRHAVERREAAGFDRAVPRRVLHAPPDAHHLVRGMIYPVADPDFPFLGVHFTRIVHGGIECGPNAVLAFAREGYTQQDHQSAGSGRMGQLRRLLANGGALLADRAGRNVAKLQQAGVRAGAAAAGSGDSTTTILIRPRPACGPRPSRAEATSSMI